METPLTQSVGYTLKRVQSGLRAALDGALREHGLTVAQYACLEQLRESRDLSNADLARGAFVSRQAMHQLLVGLEASGLVRSDGEGRRERFALSPEGARRLTGASRAAAGVEERMLSPLSPTRRARLLADLNACLEAWTA